jgi:hypothetical protein
MDPLLQFDFTKAFWVQNMVSNLAYSRWADAYPILRRKIDGIHSDFVSQIQKVDESAYEIYQKKGSKASIDYVTRRSVDAADNLHALWLKFYGELFARFRDFLEVVECSSCPKRFEVKENGMTEAWKKRIVQETGDHYAVHGGNINRGDVQGNTKALKS